MKKIICIIFAVIMVMSFSACGGAKVPTALDLASIGEKIVSECDIQNPMPMEKDAVADLYSIAAEDISESVCYAVPNGAFPDEIVIVKASNDDAKSRINDAFQSRIDDVKQQAQNYSPENFKLAQECKVISNGDYYALFISAKHADMEKIFADAAK